MKIQEDRLQKFYIAYYGRAADPSGLSYWQDNNVNDEMDAVKFFGSTSQDEFDTLYGNASDPSQFIAKVYDNLFNRSVDSGGQTYWMGEYQKMLSNGLSSDEARAEMVVAIMDGASAADQAILNAKLNAAKAYTDYVDNQGFDYENTMVANRDSARDWLHNIEDSNSQQQAVDALPAQLTAAVTDYDYILDQVMASSSFLSTLAVIIRDNGADFDRDHVKEYSGESIPGMSVEEMALRYLIDINKGAAVDPAGVQTIVGTMQHIQQLANTGQDFHAGIPQYYDAVNALVYTGQYVDSANEEQLAQYIVTVIGQMENVYNNNPTLLY